MAPLAKTFIKNLFESFQKHDHVKMDELYNIEWPQITEK